MSDHIACQILENDEWTDWYIEENQKRLSENYALTIKFLHGHDVPYYAGSNTAFFIWADLGAVVQRRRLFKQSNRLEDLSKKSVDITADIMSKLLERKVFLASGQAFGSERPGWF